MLVVLNLMFWVMVVVEGLIGGGVAFEGWSWWLKSLNFDAVEFEFLVVVVRELEYWWWRLKSLNVGGGG